MLIMMWELIFIAVGSLDGIHPWAVVGSQMRGNLVMWVTDSNCRRGELQYGNVLRQCKINSSSTSSLIFSTCSHHRSMITHKFNLIQKCCRYFWSPNSKALVTRWPSSNRCLVVYLVPVCIMLIPVTDTSATV
jgi:hypothetical protein